MVTWIKYVAIAGWVTGIGMGIALPWLHLKSWEYLDVAISTPLWGIAYVLARASDKATATGENDG